MARKGIKQKKIKEIIALKDAIAIANRFILDNLPDRFCAGIPKRVVFLNKVVWTVPITLSYPSVGKIGEVGIVAIDGEIGEVIGWTPFDEVTSVAKKIYEEKKTEIEAAFS